MATSSTYAFNPDSGSLVLNAFGLIQIRRTEIVSQHLADAQFQCNLLMVDFSNRNPNQWALETQSVLLTQGTATYQLTSRTLEIALAYITTTDSLGNTTDRVLGPISSTEYGAIPNKMQQGFPNTYWFQKLTPNPTITLWETPDGHGPYTLNVMTFRQMQDVALAGGQTLDLPYRFLDAFTFGLAARLAELYPDAIAKAKGPQAIDRLHAQFEQKFAAAAAQDEPIVNMYIAPGLSAYSGY